VIYAARIVFGDPNRSSITQEHFDLLGEQWLTQMEYLRRQVDEAIPCDEFVKACGELFIYHGSARWLTCYCAEEAIIHDTQQTEKAIADLNRSIIVESTSNIIQRANRILLVTCQEIENSEDSLFNTQLQQVSEILNLSKRRRIDGLHLIEISRIAFPPMIAAAKQVALEPNNKTAHSNWQKANNEVRNWSFIVLPSLIIS
jgi:hypothetical protein